MGRLHGLDALRGIAALMVMLLHVEYAFSGHPTYFTRSYLAVDFFFMLSGFVMARTYEADGKFALSMPAFFLVRYRRLWSPMAIGALLVAAYLSGPGAAIFARFPHLNLALLVLPMLAIVPNAMTLVLGRSAFPGNDAAWSVFAELVGNALHAALLWRLRAWHLIALSLSVLAAMQWWSPGLDVTVANTVPKGLARMVVAYAGGIALYRLGLKVGWPAWIALLGLPAYLLLLGSFNSPLWCDVTFLLVCPVLILCAVNLGHSRMAQAAGALSFPLYAVHSPIFSHHERDGRQRGQRHARGPRCRHGSGASG